MTKKQFVDKDGNKFVQVTPWYKKWWVWVIAVIAILIIIGSIGGSGNDSSSSNNSSNATAHKTTNKEKGNGDTDKSTSSTLKVDYDSYDVANKKTYNVNYSDVNWSAATIKVDKVTVYKLTKSHKYESANDGNFQANGFVRIHFIVSPTRDIDAYPTQGTAIYSNGEQHEADSLESWDGEIAKGVTKSGNVTIPVKDLTNSSSLKNIRYKFDADYDTDDIDDDNSDHTYDFTLNLQ